jgi:hypothetical protein
MEGKKYFPHGLTTPLVIDSLKIEFSRQPSTIRSHIPDIILIIS